MPALGIDKNIAKAKILHTDYYSSQYYFDISKEKIFAGSWQFIGDNKIV